MENADHFDLVPAPETSAPVLYTHVADDPNAQANNLRGWTQIYDQLSGGGFSGELNGACFGGVHLFRESTSLSLRQSCEVGSRGWWFGIPVTERDSFRLDSRRIEGDSIAVRPGHQPFELITPENFRIFGIVIDFDRLARCIRATYPEQGGLSCLRLDAIQIAQAKGAALRRLIQEVLEEITLRPAVLDAAKACSVIENNIVETVADLCMSSVPFGAVSRCETQSSLIVRNVRRYLLDHADRVISVPELCAEFKVSRRTLQYAFEKVLGISPNVYMRVLRLNGARRDLRRRDAHVSVQQVAADWGFWHLSQFAKDYRALFHELPSMTLRRANDFSD